MSDEQQQQNAPPEMPEGSPVRGIQHAARKVPFDFAFGDEQNIEAISGHVEKHFGTASMVIHELVSDLVHIDIHIIDPTPERPHYVLFTTGMSDRPMTVPDPQLAPFRYAELMAFLPPDWPMPRENELAGADPQGYWPIYWLKRLARFPHEFDTWLFQDHTIPASNDFATFAPDTELCCWWLCPPFGAPDGFSPLRLAPDKEVHFLSLVPLYRDETEAKMRGGSDALIQLLGSRALLPSDLFVIDPKRPRSRRPEPPKRRGFWPFGRR